jgi:hypothetical protein
MKPAARGLLIQISSQGMDRALPRIYSIAVRVAKSLPRGWYWGGAGRRKEGYECWFSEAL